MTREQNKLFNAELQIFGYGKLLAGRKPAEQAKIRQHAQMMIGELDERFKRTVDRWNARGKSEKCPMVELPDGLISTITAETLAELNDAQLATLLHRYRANFAIIKRERERREQERIDTPPEF